MLRQAGVAHDVDPARVDEARFKAAGASAMGIASRLAEEKALDVSRRHIDRWVIGSDSVASVGDRHFDKPSNREEAAEHLRFFSGKSLILTSAVAIARGAKVQWSHSDEAYLQVRPLGEDFIASYLDCEWPAVAGCVGVFRMEGPGIQLFESVSGDYFTILGMPLFPLLGALRRFGVLKA